MKIALIGYGKMGHEIENVAVSRGHEIVFIEDALINPQEFDDQHLQKADIAIEFTRPDAAFGNYMKCFHAGIPVVSGTTGWLEKLPEVKRMCAEEDKTFFYSSNYSIGVNIFFRLNKFLAEMMNGFNNYDVKMQEIHHIHKLDKPSGTAITLAEGVMEKLDRKNAWTLDQNPKQNEILIDSVREGEVPGTHSIKYFSDIDDIQITHTAYNRTGLAFGAVLAAEFLFGKPSGFYSMDDMMKF
ncbi:MAG: 4-hydroxy-tetrahydrodipicolinate reductase [Bacteroidales bacterium]|nr:4-hydroxy-tetrahydrodipicolinate reductase [Bacteroidales bacterium]